ncbi:MAG: hypothetical protein ACJ76X_10995 [Solirubrobacteraceae bacterium]
MAWTLPPLVFKDTTHDVLAPPAEPDASHPGLPAGAADGAASVRASSRLASWFNQRLRGRPEVPPEE